MCTVDREWESAEQYWEEVSVHRREVNKATSGSSSVCRRRWAPSRSSNKQSGCVTGKEYLVLATLRSTSPLATVSYISESLCDRTLTYMHEYTKI